MTLFDTTPTPAPAPQQPAPVHIGAVSLVWVVTQRYRLDGLWREIATATFMGATVLRCQLEADPPVYDSFTARSPRSLSLDVVLRHIAKEKGTA